MTTLTHLECTVCGQRHEAASRQGRCACGGPLLARYDLELARASWSREWVRNGPSNLWRYAPVLPVRQAESVVSLGEGMTPLVRLPRLGRQLGLERLWVKQEGVNPTGSWKARRMACAVSMALELGFERLAVASPGNAAVALAAYAAAAGMKATVRLPGGAPEAAHRESEFYGALVTAQDQGPAETPQPTATDAAVRDASPWQEPYALEGAKTLGFELAEQFHWNPPDAVVCPCGSGIAIAGLFKAFDELETLGWTAGPKPRLIAVRVQNGATAGLVRPLLETDAVESCARGLVLAAMRDSRGELLEVPFQDVVEAGLRMAALEGILPSPEGAACVLAIERALAAGTLRPEEHVVIVNPAAGLRRMDLYGRRARSRPSERAARQGGLITPR